jgi:hypothetical protein
MPPVTSAAFVARGPEAREEAILWAKRYGKNCMDAHSPSVGKALRQTTNRQRPAAEKNAPGAKQQPDPVVLPAAMQDQAVRPRPASASSRQRSASAQPAKKPGGRGTSKKRVSLAGLAKLEERERRLSRVSFCADADRPRPRPTRKQRPASASARASGGADTVQASHARPARPASAPSSRRAQRATFQQLTESESAWPALCSTEEDVDGTEEESGSESESDSESEPELEPEPEPEPEPQPGTRSTPQHHPEGVDGLLGQLHDALDRAQGRGWDHRKLVCGAVLDALADRDTAAAALLRRVGSEMSGLGEPSAGGGGGGSPKLKPIRRPHDLANEAANCSHCGAAKAGAGADDELKSTRDRMARAEAAAAHLQRQVSLERSRARDAAKRAEELEVELQNLRAASGSSSAHPAPAGVGTAGAAALRASSEYSWDGHSDKTTGSESSEDDDEEEEEENGGDARRMGLSSECGRPSIGCSVSVALQPLQPLQQAAAPAVTDYAPPVTRSGAGLLPLTMGLGAASAAAHMHSVDGGRLTRSVPVGAITRSRQAAAGSTGAAAAALSLTL